jgi:lysyl-tRNA synthetase class 2
MFKDKYSLQHIAKMNLLKEKGLNPFAQDSKRDSTISEFLIKHKNIGENRDENNLNILTGRIKFFRLMGKASFLKIQDESGLLQIYVSRDNLSEGFYNDIFKKCFEIGDIVEVRGYGFNTNKGELSLHVNDIKMLTKSLASLPEKFHGITDKELRYRQRYLDLIMNDDVKKTFHIRSKIISLTREFFESKAFLEVETPMMHPISGGANAKPFSTFHNALGVDRFLRIAPELYLKRLIVGGFENIFEINRNFRNEGMDLTHNPEFTSIEFYCAYKNYHYLMDLTKEYLLFLLNKLNLNTSIEFGDKTINFTSFKTITMLDSINEIGGIDKNILNDKVKILELLKQNDIYIDDKLSNSSIGKLHGELFDLFVEDKLINPTFITNYPIELSPLARKDDNNANKVQRFELFIGGYEVANAFNELNDPIDQLERFSMQMQNKDNGDDEAHEMDEDFIKALSYGMPPTAGEGIGLDRLVMILTNNKSIRDVLLFPAMKPIAKSNDKVNLN